MAHRVNVRLIGSRVIVCLSQAASDEVVHMIRWLLGDGVVFFSSPGRHREQG